MSGQTFTFATVGTIIDAAVAEAIGSSASSLTALQDLSLIRYTDWVNRQFLSAAHTQHGNDGFSWMKDQRDLFPTFAATSLASSAATGAVSITVASATGFPTSGQLFIRTANDAVEFVPFSAVAGVTITTSALSLAHASGEHVELCYALPTNFGKIKHVMVNSVQYFYEDVQDLPRYGHYTLNGGFIVFPYDFGAEDVTIVYDKKPTTVSTGVSVTDRATETDIPVEFQRYGIEMVKSYILTVRRKREDAAQAQGMAQLALQEALAYDISNSTSSPGLRASY